MSGLTYREAVLKGTASLGKCGVESPEYDSRQLMFAAASMDDTMYLVHSADMVPADVMETYEDYIKLRGTRVPLQHILGEAYFYGRPFVVNSDVLVPRHDTEVLAENVLDVTDDGSAVLDMCTGSGCIIITLALEKNLSLACGCDISQAALSVAEKNADRLCIGRDVRLRQSDLFENIKEYRHRFDCIVSNPPYIETDEINSLQPEVRLHEPVTALDGSSDGLEFYRRITAAAPEYLTEGGYLFYEIGSKQGKSVAELMSDAGFKDIRIKKDLAGLDRVVCGHI